MQFASTLLYATAFTSQVLRLTVWSGLVVATIALLVLMRTRWGQSQPLRKCIVLSTLVHLLFGIYTTTVNIVVNIGKGNSEAPMWVSIDDGTDLNGSYDTDPGDSEVESDEDEPWNRFATSNTTIDEKLTVPKLREDLLKSAPSKLPEVVASPLEKVVAGRRHDSEPTLPALDSETPRVAGKAAPIEAPQPKSEEPSPTSSAMKNELPDRYTTRAPLDAPPVGPPDLPQDLLNSAAALTPPRYPADELRPQGIAGSERIAVKPAGAGAGAPSNELEGALVPVVGHSGEGSSDSVNQQLPAILKGRVGSDRLRRAIANGGSEDTEAAVVAALKWLAEVQSEDGRWDTDRYEGGREVMVNGENRRGAGSHADTGITGLALLAFLAHGNTHLKGEHPKTVQRGLEWLLSMQGADGNLGGDAMVFERMYCHAMATCALSEAYAMSGDNRLEAPVRQAIGYCLKAQDKNGGGWRYQPGDAGDTSQLGWQVMALKSAELAGIEMPSETRAGMVRFLKSVGSGKNGGLASYKPGHRVTSTMTAEALVCRQFLGMSRDNPAANEAGNYLLAELPGEGDDNVYYWYYGTLGMFQLQGQHWQKWNSALQDSLLKTQRNTGDLRGSWDPDKVWGGYGGRVYSTALSTLCLEVYYRFLPLYVEAASRDARQE